MRQKDAQSKDEGRLINTNTILLNFNWTTLPKTLRIFYRIINVAVYIPNPLRCFNYQKTRTSWKKLQCWWGFSVCQSCYRWTCSSYIAVQKSSKMCELWWKPPFNLKQMYCMANSSVCYNKTNNKKREYTIRTTSK